jgi:hypothetical protein
VSEYCRIKVSFDGCNFPFLSGEDVWSRERAEELATKIARQIGPDATVEVELFYSVGDTYRGSAGQ